MKIGWDILIDGSALLLLLGQSYGQRMDKMPPIPLILYCTTLQTLLPRRYGTICYADLRTVNLMSHNIYFVPIEGSCNKGPHAGLCQSVTAEDSTKEECTF